MSNLALHADLSDLVETTDAVAPTRAGDALLVIAAFSVGQAIQINNGVINPAAMGWLGIALVSIFISFVPALAARCARLSRMNVETLLVTCIGIQIVELFVWDMWWSSGSLITTAALVIGFCAAVLARQNRTRLAMPILLGCFTLAAMITIRTMPTPYIDVWLFQQKSTAALLNGFDPYGVKFPDVYGPATGFYSADSSVNGWLTYSFPYPPLTLLLTAPGRLLGDVRIAHLLGLNVAALLIYASAPSRRAMLAIAMLLFTPRSLLVVKAGWTEPLVILALASVIYCARRAPSTLWFALGALLAAKQYAILAMPLVPLLMPRASRREIISMLIKSLGFAAAISLPFFLWNPTSFFRSVVLWQFRQPFRADSLSYPAMISRMIGGQPGVAVSLAAACAAIAFARKRSARNAFGFVSAFAFVMLVFFAMSKQAFCNYYFLVIGATCTAIALSTTRRADANKSPTDIVTEESLTAFPPPRIAA